MESIDTEPRVYVGTYAKYNNGSIKGAWIDLDGMDQESFLEKCRELHNDEADPEFMFQDFEGFPKTYYGESGLDDGLWDWLALDDDDKELLAVYQESVTDGDIDQARDNFAGRASDLESWCEEFLADSGGLESIPENLRYYFDYEKYARDLELGGDIFTVEHDGEIWIFWNR